MLPSSIFAELAADEGKGEMAEIPLDNREMEKQVESVPGPSKIDPTSPEWRTCMEEATAAKKAKATPKKKTVENKKTAPKKTLLKKTPPKKTTPKKTPPKEMVKPTKNASKKTATAKKPKK